MKIPEKLEAIIYDTMKQMSDNSQALCDLVNEHGTDEQKQAYKEAVYAPVVRFSLILGEDAIARHKTRHEEIRQQVKAYLHNDS